MQRFVAGKTIKGLDPEFFQLDGQAYWTVWIEYEPLISGADKVKTDKNFNPVQQQLLIELQQWRREKADIKKIPVYIIATNKELAAIVESLPKSLEGLRMIQGLVIKSRWLFSSKKYKFDTTIPLSGQAKDKPGA